MTTGLSKIVNADGTLSLSAISIRAVRTGGQPSSVPFVTAAIVRIPDGGPLDFSPIPTLFGQDLSDTLGDYGTGNDGWEQLLGVMETTIGPDADALDQVVAILGEITDTDYPGFAANTWQPISDALAPFYQTGDNLLTSFNTDLNPPPPPTPAPAPPPPGGGGPTAPGGPPGGLGGGGPTGPGGPPAIPLPCGVGFHPTPDGGCEPDPRPQPVQN